MKLERFWDSEKMVWYGPGGVGTARALRGFQEVMQGPWKRAFPDSATDIEHLVELGEGPYAAYAGFPGMVVTHRGEYLGYPASGKKVEVRVMDWWRRDGNLLVENWVLIDLPHLFIQLGVDLLPKVQPESTGPTRGTN